MLQAKSFQRIRSLIDFVNRVIALKNQDGDIQVAQSFFSRIHLSNSSVILEKISKREEIQLDYWGCKFLPDKVEFYSLVRGGEGICNVDYPCFFFLLEQRIVTIGDDDILKKARLIRTNGIFSEEM